MPALGTNTTESITAVLGKSVNGMSNSGVICDGVKPLLLKLCS